MHGLFFLRRVRSAALLLVALFVAAPVAAQSEIVVHAREATAIVGDWQAIPDASAAGGYRLWNPDRGAGKLSTASSSPADYVEFRFTAEANRPYRLWLRGKADHNAWTNDSVFVQFSATMDAYNRAAYRIGSGSAFVVSFEDCGGCGVGGWGWQDNGWAGFGPLVYFTTSGTQTIRIQRREDGVSIDQVVLSNQYFRSAAPGSLQWDTKILPSTTTTAAPAPAPAPATPPAPSGTVTLRDSGATVIRGGAHANANLSGEALLETRVSADNTYTRRILLKFDTQNTIPIGVTVTSATLTLTVAGGNSESRQLGVYRVPTLFDTTQATWNRRTSAYSWASPGGDLAEYYGAAMATSARGSKVTFDVTALVNGAVQGIFGASRYSRILVADPGDPSRDGYKQYYSDTAGDPSVRPALTVTYGTAPAPAPAPAPEPTNTSSTGVKLRVMDWNIHHGVGTDGVYNIDRIASWMAKMNPDVVLVNEVEKYTYWGNEDQPARFQAMLQAKTGRTWYAHFSQEYGRWSSNGKGHLILSTYPFQSTGHVATTPSSGLGGGGAVSQATIVVNGRTINLLVGHLDPYDQGMRLIQARDVINFASGYAENRILAGDMNAWPDQSSIAEINKTYYDSWTVAASQGTATGISGITPFGATKKGRIDYIFYSKNAPNLVVIDSRTPDTRDGNGVMPADHRPVVTTFEVR